MSSNKTKTVVYKREFDETGFRALFCRYFSVSVVIQATLLSVSWMWSVAIHSPYNLVFVFLLQSLSYSTMLSIKFYQKTSELRFGLIIQALTCSLASAMICVYVNIEGGLFFNLLSMEFLIDSLIRGIQAYAIWHYLKMKYPNKEFLIY